MPRRLRVVAIMTAYNEADIIGPVIGHLVQQGVSVYVLDHGSTDGTVREVERFQGRGVIGIESFPGDRFPSARDAFALADILTRETELAGSLDADWFIHHDADEFRESPWEHLTLAEAIERVDRLGYTAIDFELFNFWPTDDEFRAGEDPRPLFRHYEPGREWDKSQVKCWKKQDTLDLVSSGGHDAAFPDRRVFPLRFLLRHYPIRSQAHGRRKVFVERRPRFLPGELARGWHVQHREFAEGQSFVRDPATLLEYDGERARLVVMCGNREAEERHAALRNEIDRLRGETDAARTAEAAHLAAGLASARELAAARALANRLQSDINVLQREIAGIRTSRSWRWTTPLRTASRRLFRGHS